MMYSFKVQDRSMELNVTVQKKIYFLILHFNFYSEITPWKFFGRILKKIPFYLKKAICVISIFLITFICDGRFCPYILT